MTPGQLARNGSEHAEQVAVFAWSNMAMSFGKVAASDDLSYKVAGWAKRYVEEGLSKPEPCLKWLHAIPNGGARGDSKKSNQIRGSALKAEGVKKGVSDIFLPAARGGCCGLYIEMKVEDEKKAKLSDEQVEFGKYVISQGYKFVVCYGWKSAVYELESYIALEKTKTLMYI